MAGIYIHIPFCKKACHYCNFHFSISQNKNHEMLTAIELEASMRKEYVSEKINTIYIGGGTPSLLNINDIASLLAKIYQEYNVDTAAEITLEANPDDITEDKLLAWKSCGINRLSIGVQSFVEEELIYMNRAHNAKQAHDSLVLATTHFNNISVDLIFGSPILSNKQWSENISKILALEIPHISSYALTVEPKTALHKMIATKASAPIDDDKQAKQFEYLVNTLSKAGYEHYEISNFSKSNFRSQHNSSYWQKKNYLGLGPSAHSYNGNSRQWNVSNNTLYMRQINNGIVPFEIELLSTTQQFNETIMTALRTIEGVSLTNIRKEFGVSMNNNLLQKSNRWLISKHLTLNDNHLQLTSLGKFLADGIASDLFE